jgi:ABC-type transport system substrate-binding protein
MRPIGLPWLACISALVLVPGIEAVRRPVYGGALRIEMAAALRNLDPADMPSDPAEFAAKVRLIPEVFETLVRLDEKGMPQPWLASAWRRDAARKKWVFTIRPKVKLHSGAIWDPPGGVMEVPDDKPIEQILREMARPWNAVVMRDADGGLVGTGPFRIARWEPGKNATLAAHDGYWKGRPYLDTIEIQMGRGARDQGLDFELGRADVIEPAELSKRTFVPVMPVGTIALVFDISRIAPPIR